MTQLGNHWRDPNVEFVGASASPSGGCPWRASAVYVCNSEGGATYCVASNHETRGAAEHMLSLISNQSLAILQESNSKTGKQS